MEESITSSRRKSAPIWAIGLVGLCLVPLILVLACWYFLSTIPPIIPKAVPAPDPFPSTEIVYGGVSELGFINADGSNATTVPFFIDEKTLISSWWRAMITGDSQTMIITDNFYPEIGNIFVAHPGEVAQDCKWWGIARLAADRQHILVETKQGLEGYAAEDCGTGSAPKKLYSGIFGALSADEQYSAESRRLDDGKVEEPNIVIRQLETGEERIVGTGDFPAWSRDGQWLAYTGNDGIYIIQNSAGGKPRRLVPLESPEPTIGIPVYREYRAQEYYPPIVSWSPDGHWLVYHVYQAKWHYSIFKVNVLTGEETKIIDGGVYPYWRWPAQP